MNADLYPGAEKMWVQILNDFITNSDLFISQDGNVQEDGGGSEDEDACSEEEAARCDPYFSHLKTSRLDGILLIKCVCQWSIFKILTPPPPHPYILSTVFMKLYPY